MSSIRKHLEENSVIITHQQVAIHILKKKKEKKRRGERTKRCEGYVTALRVLLHERKGRREYLKAVSIQSEGDSPGGD